MIWCNVIYIFDVHITRTVRDYGRRSSQLNLFGMEAKMKGLSCDQTLVGRRKPSSPA